MKKCPQCAQVYGDDLFYCLTDGATLVVEIPIADTETPTVVGGRFQPQPTVAASTFQQPVSYQSPPPAPEKNSGAGLWLAIIAGIFLLLIAAAGILGFAYYKMSGSGGTAEVRKSPTPTASPTSSASPSASPTPDEEAEALKKEREKLERDKQKLEKERKELEKQKQDVVEENYEDEAWTATIIDPPTNIRATPNGAVICVIRQKSDITILGPTGVSDKNGTWYYTDICGRRGVVHSSQIRY